MRLTYSSRMGQQHWGAHTCHLFPFQPRTCVRTQSEKQCNHASALLGQAAVMPYNAR